MASDKADRSSSPVGLTQMLEELTSGTPRSFLPPPPVSSQSLSTERMTSCGNYPNSFVHRIPPPSVPIRMPVAPCPVPVPAPVPPPTCQPFQSPVISYPMRNLYPVPPNLSTPPPATLPVPPTPPFPPYRTFNNVPPVCPPPPFRGSCPPSTHVPPVLPHNSVNVVSLVTSTGKTPVTEKSTYSIVSTLINSASSTDIVHTHKTRKKKKRKKRHVSPVKSDSDGDDRIVKNEILFLPSPSPPPLPPLPPPPDECKLAPPLPDEPSPQSKGSPIKEIVHIPENAELEDLEDDEAVHARVSNDEMETEPPGIKMLQLPYSSSSESPKSDSPHRDLPEKVSAETTYEQRLNKLLTATSIEYPRRPRTTKRRRSPPKSYISEVSDSVMMTTYDQRLQKMLQVVNGSSKFSAGNKHQPHQNRDDSSDEAKGDFSKGTWLSQLDKEEGELSESEGSCSSDESRSDHKTRKKHKSAKLNLDSRLKLMLGEGTCTKKTNDYYLPYSELKTNDIFMSVSPPPSPFLSRHSCFIWYRETVKDRRTKKLRAADFRNPTIETCASYKNRYFNQETPDTSKSDESITSEKTNSLVSENNLNQVFTGNEELVKDPESHQLSTSAETKTLSSAGFLGVSSLSELEIASEIFDDTDEDPKDAKLVDLVLSKLLKELRDSLKKDLRSKLV